MAFYRDATEDRKRGVALIHGFRHMRAMEDHLEAVINSLLPEIAKALRPVVRGIYEAGADAGYAKGVEEVTADLTRVLSAKASARVSGAHYESAAPRPPHLSVAADRPQSEYPTYGYGVVSGAVRGIMAKVDRRGIEAREIIGRLMREYDLDVSIMTVRDTLARLRSRGEVLCVKRTWFATEKLSRELPLNENGPPEGKPKDGPDTAHAAH
jgi:hypothetical protein